MSKTVLFQIIQFIISLQFKCKYGLIVRSFLFQAIHSNQTIQFTISMPIDRALSSVTTAGQSGPGSNGNEGMIRIPLGPSITGTSPSDCLVSYIWTIVRGGSYPSAEVQSVYSTAPPDWATTGTRNSTDNIKTNRTTLARKQKRDEK